jgi:chloramphenicol-sensitive protein RarD
MQFALGVWLFRESFEPARLAGFVLIWAALLVYTLEGWRQHRRTGGAKNTGKPGGGQGA